MRWIQSNSHPTWMTKQVLANVPARGIQQQMLYCACCRFFMKQLTVVRWSKAGARIFLADFSKGFDLFDLVILIKKVWQTRVDPAILTWIAAFLTNQKQAVRIGGTLYHWKTLKRGVPQGTKLGVFLFRVLTNNLLSDWRLRILSLLIIHQPRKLSLATL